MNILKDAESIKKFLNVCESGDPIKDFYDEDDLVCALVSILSEKADDKPLSHEWLVSIGFRLSQYKASDLYGWFELGLLDYYHVPPNHTSLEIRVQNHPLHHIKTQGQLLNLIKLLSPEIKL